MSESSKVVRNTMFLYINMVVSIVVQLVAVRILLSALGAVDFGIYNLIAGVVALFAFLNTAMAAATQRFLSYDLGKGDKGALAETFYISVVLHLVIGVVVAAMLEGFGAYYVYHQMEAPADRLGTAMFLLHCITASTVVNIITVPYEAIINVHERFGVIVSINIFDALLKLLIALALLWVVDNRLGWYGVMLATVMIITLLLRRGYSYTHFHETHFRWHRIGNIQQMKAMVSYAAWNLFGTGCGMARYQGTAVLINKFFGLVANANYGIAQQVNAMLSFFANAIVRAVRPQVVMSESVGDRARVQRLSITTCRATALMVALLAIPMYIEMEWILTLWLSYIPSSDVIMFCRSFLVIVFINQLTMGLQIGIESVGSVKYLQMIRGSMHILPLPIAYILYRNAAPIDTIMWCIVAEELLAIFVVTLLARYHIHLEIWRFLYKTIVPLVVVVVANFALLSLIPEVLQTSFIRVMMVSLGTIILLLLSSYVFLLSSDEKCLAQDFLVRILRKAYKNRS